MAGTVALTMRLPWERLLVRWAKYADSRYDRRCGLDTSAADAPPEVLSNPQFKYATDWLPTPRYLFRRQLRGIEVDNRRFVFIDLGCAKGRVVLLAAEAPFKRVLGVELSRTLFEIAQRNLNRSQSIGWKCQAMELLCMDAGEFTFPEENAILYFANPFGPEVMQRVLSNLKVSLQRHPRETYILYLNPVLDQMLLDAGFLRRIRQAPEYNIYQALPMSVYARRRERQ